MRNPQSERPPWTGSDGSPPTSPTFAGTRRSVRATRSCSAMSPVEFDAVGVHLSVRALGLCDRASVAVPRGAGLTVNLARRDAEAEWTLATSVVPRREHSVSSVRGVLPWKQPHQLRLLSDHREMNMTTIDAVDGAAVGPVPPRLPCRAGQLGGLTHEGGPGDGDTHDRSPCAIHRRRGRRAAARTDHPNRFVRAGPA